jgi:Sec-independent protein translocase protein TatA
MTSWQFWLVVVAAIVLVVKLAQLIDALHEILRAIKETRDEVREIAASVQRVANDTSDLNSIRVSLRQISGESDRALASVLTDASCSDPP